MNAVQGIISSSEKDDSDDPFHFSYPSCAMYCFERKPQIGVKRSVKLDVHERRFEDLESWHHLTTQTQ